MKRFSVGFAVASLSVCALSAYPALAGAKTSGSIQSPAAEDVVVRDVNAQGDRLSAVVVNRSGWTVRDVRLLIRHTWLWNNERHPGADSPGRASFYTMSETIPPGASAPFEYRSVDPSPPRPDGHFETEVEVVGYTEVGEAQGATR